jgi:LmbE family N-acetylglucosaminyl deacetylase
MTNLAGSAQISRDRDGGPAEGETKLILLAHQDDEIAFAPLLARFKSAGAPVRVIYLTDGGAGRAAPEVRSRESSRALASLGVQPSEISFLGNELAVPDGLLFRYFCRVFGALEAQCASIRALGEIYTLGWEGGHPDHDAAHVIAMALALARNRVGRAWQVPFYRAIDRGPPLFRLFAPLPANGPVHRLPLTWPEARLRAWQMRFFPSQWRPFAGLGPGILWHALTSPVLKMQRMCLGRIWERPMAGRLLYEARTGVRFSQLSERATAFLRKRGITLPQTQPLVSDGAPG